MLNAAVNCVTVACATLNGRSAARILSVCRFSSCIDLVSGVVRAIDRTLVSSGASERLRHSVYVEGRGVLILSCNSTRSGSRIGFGRIAGPRCRASASGTAYSYRLVIVAPYGSCTRCVTKSGTILLSVAVITRRASVSGSTVYGTSRLYNNAGLVIV